MKAKESGKSKESGDHKRERIIFHVIKSRNNWAVRKDGASRAFKVVPLREDAIKIAKNLNKKGVELVIHRKDGSVEKWMNSLKSKPSGLKK